MPENYDITLTIAVVKTSNKESLVDEAHYFNKLSFGLMTEKASDYYALVTKLLKK